MSLINVLTPKDTEEIKPGLFVRKVGKDYRSINPIAWNGKFRWKEQMRTVFCFRTIFTIALIIFICWGYYSNTKSCSEFQENPCEHLPRLNKFCLEKTESDTFELEVINGKKEDTFTLQDYP